MLTVAAAQAEAERQVVVQHRAQGRGKERMLTAGIRPATIFGCEDDNPVGEALRTGKVLLERCFFVLHH